jgi:triosephosphate isomerase
MAKKRIPPTKKVVRPKLGAPAKVGRNFTVVGNWKMNLGDRAAAKVASQISSSCAKIGAGPKIVVCPPFTALTEVAAALAGTAIALGCQDVSWAEDGAHTGEVSATMARAAGCSFAIVGHSERRHDLGETDELVNDKVARAVAAGLTPILCVGETWEERSDSKSEAVVMRQLQSALSGLTLHASQKLLVAYEPRWAIGSGNPVEPSEAAHIAHLIRHVAVDGEHFGFACANPDQQIGVLYGGSVTAENVASFAIPGVIHGVLVGGASLNPANFSALVRQVAG